MIILEPTLLRRNHESRFFIILRVCRTSLEAHYAQKWRLTKHQQHLQSKIWESPSKVYSHSSTIEYDLNEFRWYQTYLEALVSTHLLLELSKLLILGNHSPEWFLGFVSLQNRCTFSVSANPSSMPKFSTYTTTPSIALLLLILFVCLKGGHWFLLCIYALVWF